MGGVLPNSFNNLPTALLTDVTNHEENSPEQHEEQFGAPPLTDDEDDDEEEIFHSSDEEEEKQADKIPEQTILASLMEGKTPICQNYNEDTVPQEETETIAAAVITNEEEEDEISTLFVSMDLNMEEKELCEEKRSLMQSKLILHPDNRSKNKSSHVTICLAKVKKSDETEFTKNIQVAINSYYKEKNINKLTFHNPTMFRSDNQVTTLNIEPTGADKLFLTGLHQHLLTTIGKQIQQDEEHGYTPHLTMFTKKPDLPLPDLLPEELQLCNTDTIHRVDGESQYTITQPIMIMPSALTIRRLGSAEVISSLKYDQASASIIPDTLIKETRTLQLETTSQSPQTRMATGG